MPVAVPGAADLDVALAIRHAVVGVHRGHEESPRPLGESHFARGPGNLLGDTLDHAAPVGGGSVQPLGG